MSTKPEILEKEPWWEQPPKPGQSDADIKWGYLLHCADGQVLFSMDETPTPEEIANRTGCRLATAHEKKCEPGYTALCAPFPKTELERHAKKNPR